MIYSDPVMKMKKQLQASLCLLLTTVIWGAAFIAQRVGMDYIGPFTFQTVRCTLAALFLFPVIFLFDRDKKAYFRQWKKPKLWKTGLICGAALFVASGLQQVGIQYTTAGKAGFITAMYIVLVPVLGLFLGRHVSPAAWIGVGLATAGLYLLSCAGVSKLNRGDVLLFGCALAFAVQITLIDRLAVDLDSLRLNCIQSLVCALLSAAVMAVSETFRWDVVLRCWLPLCYAGILSMGVAYSLQIIGQRHLNPTAASLIMSMESVFAALFGWLLLRETMTAPELAGCVLVFTAVILSQLPERLFRQKKHG